MQRNLARILTETAVRQGDATAVKLDELELSYRLLDAASARIVGLLRERGIRAGEAVGVMLPNVPYFPIVYYGILRAGGVIVPMNVLLREREVAYYLTDSRARLIFAWHDFAPAAQGGADQAAAEAVLIKPGEFEQLVASASPVDEVADVTGDDTAVILYTSGTTGQPKGAELTHDNLYRNATVCARTLIDISERDVLLGALPLFHSFGQTCALNAAMVGGGCLTLLPRFDAAKALEILQRDRVTLFLGVPTMYAGLLFAPEHGAYDTSSLRVCLSGGAAMPVELMRGFERAFGCQILEGYGLSETSPVASFNHPGRPRKPGSIGTAIEGVEMKVVDDEDREVPGGEVGEIVIRGHNVMKGYLRRPEATAEAMRGGWFHTGDLARRDDEGYFFIVDRKKEMIIRGGFNVYPREVEEVLYEHPAVQEAAVVGFPDDVLGEEIGAAVVLRAGESVTADELREYLRRELAGYKYPRRIWFLDELPKGPTGKILKREIKVPKADQPAVEPAERAG